MLQVDELKDRLRRTKGLSAGDLGMIDAVLAYGGVASRSCDLFGNSSIMSKLSTTMKRGLKGVDNVYTQHEPLLCQTLEVLVLAVAIRPKLVPWGGDAWCVIVCCLLHSLCLSLACCSNCSRAS